MTACSTNIFVQGHTWLWHYDYIRNKTEKNIYIFNLVSSPSVTFDPMVKNHTFCTCPKQHIWWLILCRHWRYLASHNPTKNLVNTTSYTRLCQRILPLIFHDAESSKSQLKTMTWSFEMSNCCLMPSAKTDQNVQFWQHSSLAQLTQLLKKWDLKQGKKLNGINFGSLKISIWKSYCTIKQNSHSILLAQQKTAFIWYLALYISQREQLPSVFVDVPVWQMQKLVT